MNKKRLGKGLDALIPELKQEEEENNEEGVSSFSKHDHDTQEELTISDLTTSPNQPRKEFSQDKLSELAESIKSHGVIQPIIVRPTGSSYQIVAGERRFRAAKQAGLETVPVIIKDFTESEVVQIGLLENIQREDLNPIDKSEALKSLIDEYGLTQSDLSQRLGIGRSSLANLLRLLHLNPEVRELVKKGELSEGHARCLTSLEEEEQITLAREIVEKGLSVRKTEELVKQTLNNEQKQTSKSATKKDPFITDIEDRLAKSLGTKVKINQGKKKGKIEIEFMKDEDLENLISRLMSE